MPSRVACRWGPYYITAGRQVALIDANSHRTTSLFSGRGDLLSTKDALGAYTSWQYDPAGNTILRTGARSRPTSYTVDVLNRTVRQLYIDGTRVTDTFDPAGQGLSEPCRTRLSKWRHHR